MHPGTNQKEANVYSAWLAHVQNYSELLWTQQRTRRYVHTWHYMARGKSCLYGVVLCKAYLIQYISALMCVYSLGLHTEDQRGPVHQQSTEHVSRVSVKKLEHHGNNHQPLH